MDSLWKIYLNTVYRNEEELQAYIRGCERVIQDRDVQERLRELRGETGKSTHPTGA